MTESYTVQVSGMSELVASIKKYPELAGRRYSDAINKALAILSKNGTDSNFQFKAPRSSRSGYLQASWGQPGQGLELATPVKLSGRIWSNAKYAIFVHEGTAAHVIRAVKASVLANRKTGQFFGKVVNHPGTKANKFLPRIISASQADIDAAVAKAGDLLAQDIAQK